MAWEGVVPALDVPMPSPPGGRSARVRMTLNMEDGRTHVDDFERSPLRVPVRLPLGYHRLVVEGDGVRGEAAVIAAPRRCWSHVRDRSGERAGLAPWGVFAPVYALAGERDWGAGDLADLQWLCEQVERAGGAAVATLPLLAGFMDRPFEPAPYRPVSRLFWNEVHLAVERVAEFGSCAEAGERWRSSALQDQVARLRMGAEVDYRTLMALKRSVLEPMAECFFDAPGPGRWEAFHSYLEGNDEAEAYARFRAAMESEGVGERRRPGGRFQTPAERYHLYCQWQMEEQLTAAALSSDGSGLFLDMPVGVHPHGFDTQRWPQLFLHGLSSGAPPDAFFSLGQDWECPPLHPERGRESGHSYFAAALRRQMAHARYLRVDHVMALHRLFVIPVGAEPSAGTYLHYPAEESYAVLALESQRSRTAVVGEDLGTVPVGVRSSMRRHGVSRTWVFQTTLSPRSRTLATTVPAGAVASINTHDMVPLAGFLEGRDIDTRVETGQSTAEEVARARSARARLVTRLTLLLPDHDGADPLPLRLLRCALRRMAAGRAALVLVSLEDLLMETEPQNVPGTGPERPNWRRKILASRAESEEAIRMLARWLRP